MKEEDEKNKIVGTVTEALPNTMFRIDVDNSEQKVLAYLSGKMRRYRIKVLIGDKVEVITDDHGEKGRLIRRL